VYKCNPASGDEPFEMGPFQAEHADGVLTFAFHHPFGHFRVPCHLFVVFLLVIVCVNYVWYLSMFTL